MSVDEEKSPVSEMELNMPRTPVFEKSRSLWGHVKMLPLQIQRQLLDQYRDPFTVEVRDKLADLIEQLPWSEVNEENSGNVEDEGYANQMLESVLNKLSETIHSTTEFVLKTKLRDSEHKLRQRYMGNALEFVKLVKSYLSQEERAVAQAENATSADGGDTQYHRQIDLIQRIESLQGRTQVTQNYLQTLDEKFKQLIITRQKHSQIKVQTQQVENQLHNIQNTSGSMASDIYQQNLMVCMNQRTNLTRMSQDINHTIKDMASQLVQIRLDFTENFQKTHSELEVLQQLVDQEVLSWNRQQRLAGNGAEFDTRALATIQNWFEGLADLTWKNRNQVSQMESFGQDFPIDVPQGIQDIVSRLRGSVNNILTGLVRSAFIVECQPPQILKVNNKFTAKVRLMLGNKLKIYMDPRKVTAVLLSERQLSRLQECENPHLFKENSGKLLNDNGRMEYNETTREHSVSLKSMQLQKINRADRKQNVTEEKFCIVFKSTFQIGNQEQFVWTKSNPIVVIVHGSQECRAMATIMWDNQFAIPERQMFEVPDFVPWPQMCELLSCKFKQMTQRGLGKNDLDYLAHKIFQGGRDIVDYSPYSITWAQFVKENQQLASGTVSFTFWDWFHSIMKLTRKHLRELWQDRCIVGFISRSKAEQQLLSVDNGNFLLRFSESELGGITVGWVDDVAQQQGDENEVKREANFAQPYEADDFCVKSLAERIKDVDKLVYLYPNRPKEQVFKKYWLPFPGRNSKKPHNPRYKHMGTLIQDIIAVPTQTSSVSRKREKTSENEEEMTMEPASEIGSKTAMDDMSGFGSVFDNTLNVEQIMNAMDIAHVSSPDSIQIDAFDELISEDDDIL
ncbi:signal transducer and activator of transcription 5A-like isoform X1 [Mizuhopecten yessoensis]|uniref:Signal transducer and activator of transcription n=2 Tax=Mizuhopecten yessoensis TaxID=6573 RepID=A0A210QH97_MIZYE|nr:signal transducer and activator of transcription 5A-like isoform X1 [Mizuhopecten yessoensis]OWF48112.1 Signal transducer and activator of transcription 5A [Mizuhopecten yessoensis]